MKFTNRAARLAAAFACTLAFSVSALAQPVPAEETEGETAGIPAYSIARLKVLAGSAWARTPDGQDWEEVPTNTPLTPNSRISVPEDSEAELQFRGGQFVLLTAGTDLEVRDMEEEETAFRLRAGEIRFDLPEEDFGPVAVRIPGGGRTNFTEPGRYWLTVTDDDATRLVVRRGKASLSHEERQYRVLAGEEVLIGEEVVFSKYEGGVDTSPPPEPPTEAERGAEVPPVVYDELQEYGEWVSSPSYGYVWRPRVAVGWSPYVYGRWVWIVPYGWTWVSYEPWGWYPYHSGYWVSDPAFGWVWTPYNAFVSVGFVFGSGHRQHHRRFQYVPSNVRFVSEGRNVRWVPLRPGERFRRPAEFRRGDPRLSRWNRPLDRGRVFARPGPGKEKREWRDVTAVRTERQKAIRAATPPGARRDARPVRPELQRRGTPGGRPVEARPPQRERTTPQRGVPAPKGGPAVERRTGGETRSPGEGAVRPGRPERAVEPKRTDEPKRAVEPRRGEPAPKRPAPAPPVVEPSQDGVKPKSPVRERRDLPERYRGSGEVKQAPAPRQAPVQRAPGGGGGKGEVERPPDRQAPEVAPGGNGGRGGGDRGGDGGNRGGGGGDRGGGDRGGDRGGGRGNIGDRDRGGGGRFR